MGLQESLFGSGSLPPIVAAGGKKIYLNPGDGNDLNTGLDPDHAVKTYERGYSLLTANKNECLVYIQDNSSLSLTAVAVWAKSYTHFVGVCPETGIANRARIFMTSTVITSPMFQITGSGCWFHGLYWFHGIANAGALIDVEVTGGRNKFTDCHFAGIGHATQGDTAGCRSLKLTGAEECLFERCTIGVDTAARSTTNAEIEFATSATRNRFKDCLILAYADNAGHLFIKAGATSIDRFVIFENCIFSNPLQSAATTMTEAIDGNAGAGGYILLKNCTLIGATDWEGTQTITYIDGAAPTGNTSGLAVVVA